MDKTSPMCMHNHSLSSMVSICSLQLLPNRGAAAQATRCSHRSRSDARCGGDVLSICDACHCCANRINGCHARNKRCLLSNPAPRRSIPTAADMEFNAADMSRVCQGIEEQWRDAAMFDRRCMVTGSFFEVPPVFRGYLACTKSHASSNVPAAQEETRFILPVRIRAIATRNSERLVLTRGGDTED